MARRKTTFALLLVAIATLLTLGPARSGARPRVANPDVHVQGLLARIEELETQVAEMSTRLALLERLEPRLANAEQESVSWEVAKGLKADPAALAAIPLPVRWTVEEVDVYIGRILDESSRGHHFFEDDVQIRMLADVGPEFLDRLLEALGTRTGVADGHLDAAIAIVARPEDRELILGFLPFHPPLASIVTRYGWEDEAFETLLAGLYRDVHLSTEWLRAVAKYGDPRVDEGLHHYLVHGNNSYSAYHVLRELQHPDLSAMVAEAWAARKSKPFDDARWFAQFAAAHGHFDALELLARSAMTNEGETCYRQDAEEKLRILVNMDAPAAEIAAMIIEDVGAFRYDPETQRYFLE